MNTLFSHSLEETMALGEQWGQMAQPGWLIGLVGDLGTGKTQLVKGIALGLGLKERIHSPTFPLVHEYTAGRLPLYHLDLYRLDTPEQVIGAGLEDYFYQRDGLTVVEWMDRWLTATPDPSNHYAPARRFRQVRIESLNETERRITYEDFGS